MNTSLWSPIKQEEQARKLLLQLWSELLEKTDGNANFELATGSKAHWPRWRCLN